MIFFQILTVNSKPLVVLSLHDATAKEMIGQMSDSMDSCRSRGAGYKCITVLNRSSDAFLYTKDGSYKWDTCGPHAILLSCGGGIAILKEAIKLYSEYFYALLIIRLLSLFTLLRR